VLDADEGVLCRAGANQLVEFRLNGGTLAILAILDQKDHQKRDDRRAGIDDELPSIGEVKHGPRRAPDHNQKAAEDERDRMTRGAGNAIGNVAEKAGDLHGRAP